MLAHICRIGLLCVQSFECWMFNTKLMKYMHKTQTKRKGNIMYRYIKSVNASYIIFRQHRTNGFYTICFFNSCIVVFRLAL